MKAPRGGPGGGPARLSRPGGGDRRTGLAMLAATVLVGAGSLVFLLLFLYGGPFWAVDLGLGPGGALLFDAGLCLAFFPATLALESVTDFRLTVFGEARLSLIRWRKKSRTSLSPSSSGGRPQCFPSCRTALRYAVRDRAESPLRS